MRTKGKKTTIEEVDVEVNAAHFLEKIYAASIPTGLEYLSKDGHWYKSDGYDYHKREDLYTKDRQATIGEIELQKAYHTLREFVRENKL